MAPGAGLFHSLGKAEESEVKTMNSKSQIILYQTPDGQAKIQVKLENETVWLTQKQMAELFGTTKQNVSLHLKNIFNEGELEEDSVVKYFLTTAIDRKTYRTLFYNLDAIISIGYRINSYRGTQFRIWATRTLKEYMIKGFVMDDERLSQGKTGNRFNYYDELLERIRAIRASEKNLYEKVKEIFATRLFKPHFYFRFQKWHYGEFSVGIIMR